MRDKIARFGASEKDEEVRAAVRYVRKRDDVFQYERRVPLAVRSQPQRFASFFESKPLFRRSLRTKDQDEMHLAAVAVHRKFEALLAAAMGRLHRLPMPTAQPKRTVTAADLDAISGLYRDVTAAPFDRAYLRADSSPEAAAELDRMLYDLERDAEETVRSLRNRGRVGAGETEETPVDAARIMIARENFDAEQGSDAYGAIVSAIRTGLERGYKHIEALGSGDANPSLPKAPTGSEKPSSLTLRATVEAYLAHKQLPPKSETEVRLSLRTFEGVVGNKALDAITRTDFISFVKHLAEQKVGGKIEGSTARPLAEQTIKKRLGFLNAAINHASDRELFTGKNPAAGIKVSAWAQKQDQMLRPDKRRFQVAELNKLFQHPWFTGCASASQTHLPGSYRLSGVEFWAPVVALLTGCRASELAGLQLDEVRIDDPNPHLLIRDNQYRRTKSGYARSVPIIDALMDMGFASYVANTARSGADRLFPDWKSPKRSAGFRADDAGWSNAKIIRAFNRTVVPAMLGDKFNEGARQDLTFHSLRGAFKAMLGGAAYGLHPNIINEIIGHAKSELDQRYVGTIPIEETYPAAKSCRFQGLILPSAP